MHPQFLPSTNQEAAHSQFMYSLSHSPTISPTLLIYLSLTPTDRTGEAGGDRGAQGYTGRPAR